ncbi:hypothetical protein HWV62_32553 [Athelia sp. TMB]|nr:hypothetical protein HWV62_32553 [Athelia sp. TMB]
MGGGALITYGFDERAGTLMAVKVKLSKSERFLRAIGGAGAMNLKDLALLVSKLPRGSICGLDSNGPGNLDDPQVEERSELQQSAAATGVTVGVRIQIRSPGTSSRCLPGLQQLPGMGRHRKMHRSWMLGRDVLHEESDRGPVLDRVCGFDRFQMLEVYLKIQGGDDAGKWRWHETWRFCSDLPFQYRVDSYASARVYGAFDPAPVLIVVLWWGVDVDENTELLLKSMRERMGFYRDKLHRETLFMFIESLNDEKANAARARIAEYLARWPGGVFQLVLHTHAVRSGFLCDAVGEDGVTALYSPVDEICDYYLGKAVIRALREHHGRCGALIVSCGAAVGPGHIESVKNLIQSRTFDFVIGFSAGKVNSAVILPFVRPALVEILANEMEPWAAIVRYCSCHEGALGHTPIVVLDFHDGKVRGRQLVLSMPISHPWGFIPQCGRLDNCPALPGDVRGVLPRTSRRQGEHNRFRLRCEKCNHFCWVDRPEWIKLVTKSPHLCYETPWPMSEEQMRQAMGLDQQWKPFQESQGTSSGRKRSGSEGSHGKHSRRKIN